MKKTLYFALVTTTEPTIEPLEDCETFEEANEKANAMVDQGEIIVWVFHRDSLQGLNDTITRQLNA